jgi:pyrimidine operon attenuation protein/uracil phosphoribosyltransferase
MDFALQRRFIDSCVITANKVTRNVDGQLVLLFDDTFTSGASFQSAVDNGGTLWYEEP